MAWKCVSSFKWGIGLDYISVLQIIQSLLLKRRIYQGFVVAFGGMV
jgi:hypothetical protein